MSGGWGPRVRRGLERRGGENGKKKMEKHIPDTGGVGTIKETEGGGGDI